MIVLSILLLATRPSFTRRRFWVRSTLSCSMAGLGDPLLGDRGLNLRVGPARGFHLGEVGQVTGAQCEAQVEELFLGFASLHFEFADRELAQRAEIVAFHADT